MESGTSFDDAVKQAQAMGVAEADPSNDVDGWDAATKTAVLVNVLMDGDFRPTQVDRTGIRDVTPQMLREALARNERIKLLCRAWREGDTINTRVAPEAVSMTDPFALVTGTNSVVRFTLDTLPGSNCHRRRCRDRDDGVWRAGGSDFGRAAFWLDLSGFGNLTGLV